MHPPLRLTIRDAVLADASALAVLYNTAIQAGEVMLDGLPKPEADVRRFIDRLGEREACLVLEDDGAVAGWGVVRRYSDRAGYRFCGETFLYVPPDLRRQGHGTQILEALVARCKAYRYHHLLVRIWAANTESLTFHQQEGYEIVGVQRAIGFLYERWQDLVVLQRVLHDVGPVEPANPIF